MSKLDIQITEPVLESDFKESLKLIEENILRDKNWDLDYLKNLSSGEILVAKIEDKIVGVLTQRRPGGVFDELGDEYFDLESIKVEKIDYGFIVLVSVNKNYQGHGIGKQLLEKAIDQQSKWRAKAVGVHCWQASPGNASEKLFRYFGFEPLKMHKAPWLEYSSKLTIKEFECPVCGCPCKCDELEMIKYL